MNDLLVDKLAIREIVENWVLYRDAGDWERFAAAWHADGWMTATWIQVRRGISMKPAVNFLTRGQTSYTSWAAGLAILPGVSSHLIS